MWNAQSKSCFSVHNEQETALRETQFEQEALTSKLRFFFFTQSKMRFFLRDENVGKKSNMFITM